MRDPDKISNVAWHWIQTDTGRTRDLLAELVKMVILAVPPVKRSLVHAVMSVTNGYLPRLKPKRTIEDPYIKEQLLWEMTDGFKLGGIQPMESVKPQDVLDEFKALTERQALGLLYGCALILDSESVQWEVVFDIDDEQDSSKHTTDILEI